jgi:hypothetical protein
MYIFIQCLLSINQQIKILKLHNDRPKIETKTIATTTNTQRTSTNKLKKQGQGSEWLTSTIAKTRNPI